MERCMKERKRVYPMEPWKIMQPSFAAKYVNYLVPALSSVGEREAAAASADRRVETEKIVRHEIDMALALSAEGFAWSDALKHKLRMKVDNHNHAGESQSRVVCDDQHRDTMPVNHEPAAKKRKVAKTEACAAAEEERLMYLRKLIPGGSGEMMVDDDILLSELGSYVSCLELQVNVLRSMLQFN